MEDDLLPLSWLQEISIPLPNTTEETNITKSNATNIVRGKKSISYLLKNFQQLSSEFRTDPKIRPTYSYATLILLALNSAEGSKMSLKAIYNWIKDTFPFYKMSPSTAWQNSIRHNLSLNKCFVKVPRCKSDQPGKGGFWKLDPDCEKKLKNGENFYKLRKQRRKIAKITGTNMNNNNNISTSINNNSTSLNINGNCINIDGTSIHINSNSNSDNSTSSNSNGNIPPNAEKEEVLNTKGELVQIIDFEKDNISTSTENTEDNIEQMSLFFHTNTVIDDPNEQQQQMELLSIDWDSQHNIFELDIDQLISIGEL